MISVHQPQYLPWLGYFDKILKSDCFVFLDDVQYKHREFQNRNMIRTKQGSMWLTVPVVTKGRRGQLVNEVDIDTGAGWQERHLRSVKAWYGKAPHFDRYIGFFEKTYRERTWEKLKDLNVHFIKFLLDELGITTPLRFSSDLGGGESATSRIINICKELGADIYLSGAGGKEYLDEELFRKEKLGLKYQEFRHPVYEQLFGGGDFMPYMSAVDMLFNMGPHSKDILAGIRE